jgi:hypothetical protein
MSCLISFNIQAQNSISPSNEKLIVKKIIIKNTDGKETRSETIDTFSASEWSENKLNGEDFDIIVEDEDNYSEDLQIFSPDQDLMSIDEFPVADEKEIVMPANKAVLGVQLISVEGTNGAQVTEVIEGSAAEKAGLLEGDIILSIDGKKTTNVEEVINALSDKKPGDKVKLSYLRDTKIKTLKATLQERKQEALSMKKCTPSCMSKMRCCKPGELEKCMKLKRLDKLPTDIEKDLMIEELGKGHNKIIIKRNPGEIKIKKINGAGFNNRMDLQNDKLKQELVQDGKFNKNNNQSLNVEYLTTSPNPSNGQMKINFIGMAVPTAIQVLDLNGKEIYNEKLNDFDGTYHKDIDIKNEARGTLILKIIQGDKVMSQKIIVE